MPGCPYFIANTFSHVLGAVLLTGVSSENPAINGIDTKPLTSISLFFLAIGLLFGMAVSEPGPYKYIMFILFCFVLGQTLSGLVKKLEAENVMSQTLITVGAIFAAMTAVGFFDSGNMLKWGNYLFAGLIALVVAQVIIAFMSVGSEGSEGSEGKHKTNTIHLWISRCVVLLFTLYVGYDVQVLKVHAKLCKSNPDYVQESMNLYLDILNLFTGTGQLNN